ncbi:hypothetical protein KP509_25G068200 [Ceratopteris richardii]|uniref:RRM domain-containing protein n=1 Tax=Ceratopteris richardii TaxID=49495 RepID=A0A8T2RTU4_CERRI|nr:hypothetical protein KP509_25G068200 [Ceratopteris richardii]
MKLFLLFLSREKALDHSIGLNCAGGHGMGFRMMGLGQGYLASGIMGPGRPVMPLGIGNPSHGFHPFGGVIYHGLPQVHLHEVLAQEHLLRAHALQLAQETLSSSLRAPLNRPSGGAALQSLLALDAHGPRSNISKHFPRPPDMLMGPIGNFGRCLRPNLPTGRTGKLLGQTDSSLYCSTRPLGWLAASGPNEFQILNRGRGRGPGVFNTVWGDSVDSFTPILGGIGLVPSSRAGINVGPHFNTQHLSSDDINFCQIPFSQAKNEQMQNVFDARWKIEKERMLRNGLPEFHTHSNSMVEGSRELVKEPEKSVESIVLGSECSPTTSNLAAHLGPQTEDLKTTDTSGEANTVPKNVINLHQPLRKSRVLTISGLPEDTPMSAVIEVFEKLGKIMDFKKSTEGSVFTVTYSSETEAVSAKRNLHRSFVAGKQITVAYSHP